jgi:aspartate/methionine/tyrosine aminotransferase
MLQNFFISANSFVQRAGIVVLRDCGDRVSEMCEVLAPRRERLVAGLRELGFGVPEAPAGAFYVLADARRFGADSLELAMTLLERARVGVAPGIDFGDAAEGMLRFCFAVSDDTIRVGLERLAEILPELEHTAEQRTQGSGS